MAIETILGDIFQKIATEFRCALNAGDLAILIVLGSLKKLGIKNKVKRAVADEIRRTLKSESK